MTNGQPIIVRGAKKPISTLMKPLESVDLNTKEVSKAAYERSDACAVPAASVILENIVAFEIARALAEKFAGDSLVEMRGNYELFLATARRWYRRPSSPAGSRPASSPTPPGPDTPPSP